MDQTQPRRHLRRRMLVLGTAGALSTIGGGVLALHAHTGVQAAAVTAPQPAPAAEPVESTGPDTDTVQQGDQTDAGGAADAADAGTKATGSVSAAEPSVTEADGPGGHADPAGAAGPDGDFNN